MPLEQAALSGMRRTLLVGLVLAIYSLATVSLAGVNRLRAVEKEESARRLAHAESARMSSERLAAAGVLAAGLAHEVRSPLNAIGLAAQRLERAGSEQPDCREFAGRIRQEVRRLEGVLQEFLEFARPVSEKRERVELARLASEVVELLRPEAEGRNVRLELDPGTAEVRADPEAVRRAMINLLKNAVQASPEGGDVRIAVDRDGARGRFRVLDRGPGIEPGAEERLFDAFFTTRTSGSGLGLSLVKRIAEEHGGSCSLSNRPDGGAEACLWLPTATEPSA
jgi:signal transduction histidine kinase